MQPILAELPLDLHRAVELVGQTGSRLIALVDAAITEIVIDTKAEFETANQPSPERVVGLQSYVAVKDAGHAGNS